MRILKLILLTQSYLDLIPNSYNQFTMKSLVAREGNSQVLGVKELTEGENENEA